MATIIILLGSVLGFITAASSYVFLDYSLIFAFAIWGASGPISAVLAAIVTWQPEPAPREPAPVRSAEIA